MRYKNTHTQISMVTADVKKKCFSRLHFTAKIVLSIKQWRYAMNWSKHLRRVGVSFG